MLFCKCKWPCYGICAQMKRPTDFRGNGLPSKQHGSRRKLDGAAAVGDVADEELDWPNATCWAAFNWWLRRLWQRRRQVSVCVCLYVCLCPNVRLCHAPTCKLAATVVENLSGGCDGRRAYGTIGRENENSASAVRRRSWGAQFDSRRCLRSCRYRPVQVRKSPI